MKQTKINNKNKTPTQKNIKRSTKVVGRQKPDGLVYRVPECAAMYAAALVDPFDTPAGACVPADLFPLPSSKTKTFIRGKFALGTTGFGCIFARPVSANDAQSVVGTTAASVGGSATLLSAFTNTTAQLATQVPYTTAQLTEGVGARVVACGLRIKYIGQLMSRNGVVLSYEDPDHRDISTSFSFDTLGSNPYV
jgi:hypothetical protein